MKLARTLLSIVALFVIVVALAISALVFFINPNKLKPVIAEQVQKQTGYTVVIDGSLSWSIYPRLGVKVAHLQFLMPTQTTPFLDLKGVVFVSELGQLLRGKQKFRGDIYISELTLLNVRAQNMHVGLHWQNRILDLTPITAKLYNGRFQGIARGKDLSGNPAWSWDVNMSDIDLHALLADVNGPESKLQLSGMGQVQIRAGVRGKTREQMLNNLNGTLSFALNNGLVQGVDLNYLLKSADALINKQPLLLPTEKMDQTNFDTLKGTGVIRNGVVSTTDLTLNAPALVANGVGSINLIFQAVNLQLHLTPAASARTQWMIPVMVTGNFKRPDVRLDATELNIMIAKSRINDVKEKVREELKERVHGKAGELLQNLLGN